VSILNRALAIWSGACGAFVFLANPHNDSFPAWMSWITARTNPLFAVLLLVVGVQVWRHPNFLAMWKTGGRSS
jgi:hypothetical protein